ncbi:hypothetical protein CI109_104135 [Kwoniella shandongensis]|uniref:Uncharacterized protein n=1 Tax=Kwoniella shandongensis TaxID=1734106 RepID=A0A5M6C4T2_9TREE|nr:uncharacterized protein CI109_002952 [Kwoniella shandongensis]KAA5528792.1 hypothetical protein CI109_002952 [Kwoniella shandongensis]
MSLNSVVNNLVRAAAGISSNISDADLDSHVAKLLSEEAKARELKWSELGLSGLLGNSIPTSGRDSPDPSLPKPNKRFLASVIRTVDGHNTALLRSQARSAREARDERRGESSTGRSGSGASRLFGGALRDVGRGGGGDRKRDGRERERERGKDDGRRYRDDEKMRDDGRSERYGSDRDGESRHRSRRYDEDDEERAYRHSRRRHGHDGEKRSRRPYEDESDHDDGKRHPSRHHEKDHDLRHRSKRSHSKESERQSSRRYDRDGGRQSTTKDNKEQDNVVKRSSPPLPALTKVPSPSASPPLPLPTAISKMDKYFTQTYDPRLDLPAVPSEGLVAEVGWDNMLAILKERGKKRRHQSPTLSDNSPLPPPGILPSKRAYSPDLSKVEKKERKARKKEEKRRRRRRGSSDDDSSESEDERERRKRKERKKREKEKEKEKVSSTLLDGYEYVKKGGTREWDMGK